MGALIPHQDTLMTRTLHTPSLESKHRQTRLTSPAAAPRNLFDLPIRLSPSFSGEWAQLHFGGAPLRDERRSRRLVQTAESLARNLGGNIPGACLKACEVRAMYRLFDTPKVKPDFLQAPHRRLTRKAMNRPGAATLLIEDGSEMSWTNHEPIPGCGPIAAGKEHQQGFLLHTVLAVRWPHDFVPQVGQRRPPVEILGLADQQFHVRPPQGSRPKPHGRYRNRARDKGWLESHLWEQSTERLGKAPEGVRWVRIVDRGADIFESIESYRRRSHGFVVRAALDRNLETPDGKGLAGGSLFARARQAKPLGFFELPLRARPCHAARVARLAVSTCQARLRSPQRPGRKAGTAPGLDVTVVRVWEPEPPEGEKALEWILLHDRPVSSYEDAVEVVQQYALRWLIEEFHKGLKTGMGAEDLQLKTGQRLQTAAAILSIVTLRLLDLRETARLYPDAPADESGLMEIERRVLAAYLERELRTVSDVALAIGRLGGHMNRKADGLPGWQTLQRGMIQLRLLTQGVLLSEKIRKSG